GEASTELIEILTRSMEAPRVVPAELESYKSVMMDALRLVDEREDPVWLQGVVGSLKSFGVETEKLPERRRSIRVHTQLACTCEWNGKSYEAQVVNLGLGGLHVYVDAEPPRGDRLVLFERDDPARSRIGCLVHWTRKMANSDRRLVGVTFDETPEVLARSQFARLLTELGFRESVLYQRRRRKRVEARMAVELDDLADGSLGTVLNMGVGGVLVECEREFPEGSILCISVGPLERRLSQFKVPAQVRYRRKSEQGWQYGLRFEHLNPDQVKLLGKYVLEFLRD
ncbi:MAG: PilZ domain-containing protein, partial [Candidatus Eremiobacterota bacterium]